MSSTAVLLSGGVDSSLALALLAEEGRAPLTAFYLKIWLEDEMAFLGRCPWDEDLGFARQACALAGVPLELVSLQREYFERVVAAAVDELRAGRTPSPDVLCNQRVKYGAFLDRLGPGFDRVATGHYARVERREGETLLLKGADPVKDQTYFLCLLEARQLGRAVFPIGGLRKRAVREEARRRGLAAADRPDSQGICFLGRVPFDDFVRCHLGERPGEIRQLPGGRRLGRHPGHWFFTVGQRRGLGLGGGPWYVVGKSVDDNVVFVTRGEGRDGFARSFLVVSPPHWIGPAPADGAALEVRLRHGERLLGCRVDLGRPGEAAVTLDEADPGVAAGQFAVFYDGDRCLGGGPIAPVPPPEC